MVVRWATWSLRTTYLQIYRWSLRRFWWWFRQSTFCGVVKCVAVLFLWPFNTDGLSLSFWYTVVDTRFVFFFGGGCRLDGSFGGVPQRVGIRSASATARVFRLWFLVMAYWFWCLVFIGFEGLKRGCFWFVCRSLMVFLVCL